MGFHRAGQAGLKLLTSNDPPASAPQSAEFTGMSHLTQETTFINCNQRHSEELEPRFNHRGKPRQAGHLRSGVRDSLTHREAPSLLKTQNQLGEVAQVILATSEAEAGESLELGRWNLQGAETAPLHSSLGDRPFGKLRSVDGLKSGFETTLANMLLRKLRQENCCNLGGGHCSEPRSHHCTPAWVTERDAIPPAKKKEGRHSSLHVYVQKPGNLSLLRPASVPSLVWSVMAAVQCAVITLQRPGDKSKTPSQKKKEEEFSCTSSLSACRHPCKRTKAQRRKQLANITQLVNGRVKTQGQAYVAFPSLTVPTKAISPQTLIQRYLECIKHETQA
ncbi:hypothetical protein AAY473_001292 [Plecturocebus cupreus]